jgi:hypothetical protein
MFILHAHNALGLQNAAALCIYAEYVQPDLIRKTAAAKSR